MADDAEDSDAGSRSDGIVRQAVGRLAETRWTVAAGVAATLAVAYAGDAPLMLAVLVASAIVAVAALGPTAAEAPAAVAAGAAAPASFGGLSAEALAAAVADPLAIFDADGIVVHANAAAIAAFAIAPGMPLLLKFRAPEMQDAIQAVLAGAGNSAADYAERVPIERTFRATASAIGRSTGLYVIVFKDQSETRRIDRMRADFIANASHELRTPLASIAGFIETLRGPARNDPAARESFLAIMQGQTARMSRLIDDLLSLSRLEMKPLLSPGAAVDLRRVIGSVVDSLGPLAKESGVAIELALPDGPIDAAGDRDELFQVFENLVENACKYGQSGGRVVVSAARSDAPSPEIAVSVTDFGPGIPAEHIPRLTERFYRVDLGSAGTRKGTGLGLAIVKHILTRHGGRLSIRSELGKGSTFTAHLPAAARSPDG